MFSQLQVFFFAVTMNKIVYSPLKNTFEADTIYLDWQKWI